MARTVPVTATKTNGDLITGALWNAGPKASGDFLLEVPVFQGVQSTLQSVSNNLNVAMQFQSTTFDSEGGHSNVTNNTRYTCQVAGWYWVEGYVAFNGGAAARFAAMLAKNGVIVQGSMTTALKLNDLQSISAGTAVSLAVNDYVEVWAYQISGGTVNTFIGTDLCTSMNVFWLHS